MQISRKITKNDEVRGYTFRRWGIVSKILPVSKINIIYSRFRHSWQQNDTLWSLLLPKMKLPGEKNQRCRPEAKIHSSKKLQRK